MIIHENTIISTDVLQEEFVCNLGKCKGICCVEGEFGAPLNDDELAIIDRNLEGIKKYMTPVALKKLQKRGYYETDPDGDLVTQCIKGRDCIFAIRENGMYKCAMEKAYENGDSDFKKPVSCHLYPIRINPVGEFEALNYSRWDICADACTLGAELKVPIYKFLKEPLIRKYGSEWYADLEAIVAQMKAEGIE